jgi:hypothetical protein
MPNIFILGGYPMYVILLAGALALGAAIGFARRPEGRKLPVIGALSAATALFTLTGVAACLQAVGLETAGNPEWAKSPDIHLILIQGFGEAMSPAVLGFALLALTWLLVAVGHRRLARDG